MLIHITGFGLYGRRRHLRAANWSARPALVEQALLDWRYNRRDGADDRQGCEGLRDARQVEPALHKKETPL